MPPLPLPPLPPLASGNKERNNDQGSHSWSATDGGTAGVAAGAGPGASRQQQQQQQQQPYQRLHFALWPIDDLLLEADAAIAAASWFPASLTNLLPGSVNSGGSDGSSGRKDEVYGGSGATHSSHFFGLWPRAVPHLGHLGVWYRCVGCFGEVLMNERLSSRAHKQTFCPFCSLTSSPAIQCLAFFSFHSLLSPIVEPTAESCCTLCLMHTHRGLGLDGELGRRWERLLAPAYRALGYRHAYSSSLSSSWLPWHWFPRLSSNRDAYSSSSSAWTGDNSANGGSSSSSTDGSSGGPEAQWAHAFKAQPRSSSRPSRSRLAVDAAPRTLIGVHRSLGVDAYALRREVGPQSQARKRGKDGRKSRDGGLET